MTLTVYKELEQGSDEWLDARAGIVTASTVGRLLTVSAPGPERYVCPECSAIEHAPCVSLRTGTEIKTTHSGRTARATAMASTATPIVSFADTDTAKGLLLTLAAERITEHVEDVFVSYDMQRGTDDEPFARDAYAEWKGVTVDEVGFIVREEDGVRLGYSPDGLVQDDGLIECKSRRQPRQLAAFIDGGVPPENMAQMQAGLWVTGRKWCDYISYRDGMHLYVTRVYPEPVWQDAISVAAVVAEQRITEYVTTYHQRVQVEGLPATEKRPDFDADII